MKTQLSLAIALGLASSISLAAPTLYGEFDVSVDYLPENNKSGVKDRDVVEVNSNSSFIGLKGEEKFSNRLSAVYQAEYTLYVDDGQSGDDKSDAFVPRNLLVGLKDEQLGTLKVGKIDTPVKQLSSIVDTFNNHVDNKADITGIMTGENRIDNVVVYESPAFAVGAGKIDVKALLASGEASGIAKSKGAAKVAGRGLGDAWSASVVYNSKPIVVGIGYDKAIPSNFAGRGFLNASEPEIAGGSIFAAANTIRAIGRVNLDGGLSLKALYQTSEVEDVEGNAAAAENIDDAQGWLVGAEYTLPNAPAWTLKAQYSQNSTSYKNATADLDAQQVIAAVDYAFNKQVKAYGQAGYLTLEQGKNEDKQILVGTGLEFKF